MAFYYLCTYLTAVSLFSNTLQVEDDSDALVDAFNTFNEDEDGSISTDKIPEIFGYFGIDVDENYLDDLIKDIDTDGNGQLDFYEFKKLLQGFTPEDNVKGLIEELTNTFKDYDTKNKGYISLTDLKEILKSRMGDLSSTELNGMADTIDDDRNGKIDLDEFIAGLVGKDDG